MLHHFVNFREGIQILTSQFFTQTIVLFRFLTLVLNFALKLSALRFPFFILLGDVLRYFGNIGVDLAFVISSE